MEYSNWAESLQTETPLPSFPQPSSSYPPTYYPSYPQNPNPSSSSSSSSLPINPPGVDPQTPLNPISYAAHEPVPALIYAQRLVGDNSSSGYCLDQNWAARDAVRQFGTDPTLYAPGGRIHMEFCGYHIPIDRNLGISLPSNGSEQLAMANPSSSLWWTNTTTLPHVNGILKKNQKKAKTKIVQPAFCEVCKIECTSKDVLDQHKLGKKHKKNVEKLRESLTPTQVQPSVSSKPLIGPQLPDDKSKSTSGNKSKRKKVETAEDLEKKKMKVLEGGAAASAVKICAICNVVCNSETVYNYHLAGQKHAAMLKKASGHMQSSAS
ncbi:hypothetical protein GmHk_08G023079 [Glycine max]|nr:hypothetical protein GmHk_08G023079 [Glycine max]